MHFSKEYENWPVDGNEHLNITGIDTHGKDLEDFLANAELYLTDWHGNEGPAWDLGDLPNKQYAAIVQDFVEYLAGAAFDRAKDIRKCGV